MRTGAQPHYITGTRTGTGSALGPREAQDRDLDQGVTQPRDWDQDWHWGLGAGPGLGSRPAQAWDPEGLGPRTLGVSAPSHPPSSPRPLPVPALRCSHTGTRRPCGRSPCPGWPGRPRCWWRAAGTGRVRPRPGRSGHPPRPLPFPPAHHAPPRGGRLGGRGPAHAGERGQRLLRRRHGRHRHFRVEGRLRPPPRFTARLLAKTDRSAEAIGGGALSDAQSDQ